MTPEPWQIFPDDVLEEDQRRIEGGDWAARQRRELADLWAEDQRRQLSDWQQQLAEHRIQRIPTGQPRLDIMPSQTPEQPTIPMPTQPITLNEPPAGPELANSLMEGLLGPESQRTGDKGPMLREDLSVGDIPGGIEHVLQFSREQVAQPTAELLTRLGARGTEGPPLEADWQGMGEAWRQRGESFPAQKGIVEAALDPTNLIPGNIFAKAGLEARAGKPLAEAAGEIGRFVPGMTAKASEAAKPFFSMLQKVVDESRIPKGTGSQWSGYLKAQGVKPEELFWTGAEDYLNANAAKGVSKQELANFVRQNQVQVEEVLKGGPLPMSEQLSEPMSSTKFSQYTLPGGENYRELLLTLPRKVEDADIGLAAATPGYTSPHWDEPNVLAHIRFNDRVGADGKKVLFIEEVQSDWHQAGRSGGYAGKPLSRAERDRLSELWNIPELRLTTAQRDEFMALYNRSQEGNFVPPAPFSKTWPELSLKRMFKWAADNGYDRVAWTPGKVHADIPRTGERASYWGTERIGWVKSMPSLGGYHITIEPQVGGRVGDVDLGAEATARGLIREFDSLLVRNKDDIQRVLNASGIEPPGAREIAENRTIADKLWNRMQAADEGIYMPRKEGMAGFYDVNLPEVANKIAKRFGARVGEDSISTEKLYPQSGIVWQPGDKAVVHSIDLTPAMRTEVLTKGFPLFVRPGAAGAVAGGLVGATQGNTPEERARNALIGAAGGAAGAEGLAAAPKAIKAAAPMAGKLLKEEKGQLTLPGFGPPPPPSRVPKTKPTYGPPKDTGWEHTWNRTRSVISHMGPAGKELSERLHEWRNSRMAMAGDWVSRMPTIRKLTKQEFENFADVAESKAQPLNAKVQQAFQEWSVIRDEVYTRAKAAGLDVGFLADYFPHRFDTDMLFTKNKTEGQKILDHMISIGAAKTDAEAQGILNQLRNEVRTHKVSNLELQRKFNLPGYKRDLHAVLAYTEEAADGIARAEQLGYKNAKANDLLAKMTRDGWDRYRAEDLFAIATGGKDRDPFWENASGVVRAANVLTKLSLGALTNAAQSVNTATVGGGLRTLLKTPGAMFSPEAHEFALRAGVILDSTIAQVMSGGGFTRRASAIGAPLFQNVERFNRTLAAIVGREMARDAFKAADAKALSELGLDAQAILQRGRLTIDDEVRAAQNVVERTQFYVEPQDLPGWASSPLGKLVAQFRTFGYNQTAFLGREILQPAAEGNVKPLIRFLLYGLPTGATVMSIQDFLRHRDVGEEDFRGYLMRAAERIGTMGVVGDMLRGVDPRQSGNLPGYVSRVSSTLFGPSMGTFSEGVSTLPSTMKGNFEPLGRFAAKQVPWVGPTAKNVLMPKQPQSKLSGKFDRALSGISTSGRGRFDAVLGR